MNCKYPVKIFDKTQGKTITVPCGKCIFCCSAKSRDWQNRLKKEFNWQTINFFVTLTYDEDNLPYLPYMEAINPIRWNRKLPNLRNILEPYELQLSTIHNTNYRTESVPSLNSIHICNFFKKFRQNLIRQNGKFSKNLKAKYYAIGEYGPNTFRPHYHCIIGVNFNNVSSVHDFMRNLKLQTKSDRERVSMETPRDYISYCISKSWSFGFSKIDNLNDERIQYCTKYMFKFNDKGLIDYLEKYPGLLRPFKRSSNGIGEQFVKCNSRLLYNTGKLTVNNHTNRLPRYMRNKLFETLPEEKQAEFKQRFYFDEQKQYNAEIKRLHYYLALNHKPLHNNINDYYYQKWLFESMEQKEFEIKQYLTKKRKL